MDRRKTGLTPGPRAGRRQWQRRARQHPPRSDAAVPALPVVPPPEIRREVWACLQRVSSTGPKRVAERSCAVPPRSLRGSAQGHPAFQWSDSPSPLLLRILSEEEKVAYGGRISASRVLWEERTSKRKAISFPHSCGDGFLLFACRLEPGMRGRNANVLRGSMMNRRKNPHVVAGQRAVVRSAGSGAESL